MKELVFLKMVCYNIHEIDKLEVFVMEYRTRGVCSQAIRFDIVDNKVTGVQFVGGCSGNTQGVARLVEGMDVNEAISRLEGIHCGPRSTSCPDQLAHALKAAIAK